MLRHRKGGFVFLLLLLWGCNREQVPLPALSEDAVILAFGDSLTYGTGADGRESYPFILAALTNREIINAGVPGEITRDGLKRLPALLEENRPALLILVHGGNDMLRKIAPAETKENLRRMIASARERDVAVAMLGVPRPGLLLKSADFYQAVARESRIPIDTAILPDILSDNQLKSDPIHPNPEGYRVMAQALLQLLRESGAVK